MLQSLEDSYTAMRKRKENANPQGISNCLSQYLEEIILTISIAELLAKVFNQEEIIMISGKSQLNSKPFQLVYLRFAAQVPKLKKSVDFACRSLMRVKSCSARTLCRSVRSSLSVISLKLESPIRVFCGMYYRSFTTSVDFNVDKYCLCG